MDALLGSLELFRRFVRDRPLGVVATTNSRSGPEASLVSITTTSDGDLLFNSSVEARKIRNIQQRDRVAVVIGCVGDESLQVEGDAVVERGAQRDAAAAAYLATFPGSRTSSPEWALVRVRPHWLRHYSIATDEAQVVEGRPEWFPLEPRPTG